MKYLSDTLRHYLYGDPITYQEIHVAFPCLGLPKNKIYKVVRGKTRHDLAKFYGFNNSKPMGIQEHLVMQHLDEKDLEILL